MTQLSRVRVVQAMKDLILQADYPCVPAVRSYERGEYMVELCDDYGSGKSAAAIARGLIDFRQRQKLNKEPFLSFWAVWPNIPGMNEEEHDQRFWSELSRVAALSDSPWDPSFSPDPKSKRFCFSFGGEAWFVVGLHPGSARKARQFKYPAIVFNLYSQFEDLADKGVYDSVVRTNRKREMAFQGDLNPMVEKYADSWEAIAFSGKSHPATWQCPFQHLGPTQHV